MLHLRRSSARTLSSTRLPTTSAARPASRRTRSRRRIHLPTGSDRTVHSFDPLTAEQLDAVAEIWKRERREFATFFDGTSMMPAIAPGEQVVVLCGVEAAVGDVILFRFDNQIGV